MLSLFSHHIYVLACVVHVIVHVMCDRALDGDDDVVCVMMLVYDDEGSMQTQCQQQRSHVVMGTYMMCECDL